MINHKRIESKEIEEAGDVHNLECEQCFRKIKPHELVLARAGEDHPPLHKRCKDAWIWDDLDELDKEPMGF